MVNWEDIHPDFSKYSGRTITKTKQKLTYQELWERWGITYEEAKEWLVAGFQLTDYQQVRQWKTNKFNPQETKSWMDIGFTPYNLWEVKQWKNHSFSLQQTKAWIENGLNPKGHDFAYYLKKDGYQPANLNENNREELEKKYAWQDIHKEFSFAKRIKWEEQGFDYQETKSWINAGLKPIEANFASYLKQNNYQPVQLNADNLFQLRKEHYPGYPQAQAYLDKNYPCDCNNYVKEYSWSDKLKLIHKKNCSRDGLQKLNLSNLNLTGDLDLERFSSSHKNPLKVYLTGNPRLGEIKNKYAWITLIYKKPQEFLNHQYPNKNQVEKIDLINLELDQPSGLIINGCPNLKEIKGHKVSNITKVTISNCPQLEKVYIRNFKNNQELILNSLPNLKEFICFNNNLTALDLSNCANLEAINCWNNHLTEIKLPIQEEKLERLYLSNNNFNQDLSFLSRLVNLKRLNLGSNNFYGSLEPLQNMNKLETLWINDTDLDSGLEYLPESVKEFYCSTDKREDAKVKAIYNLFANDQGVVEAEYGNIENFPQKLQEYKQKTANAELVKKVANFENIPNLTDENPQISSKKQELTQLLTISQEKLNEHEQDWLETLLEMQEELTKSSGQDKTAQKQLNKAKEKLSKKLRKSEMENLCELQEEITQLESQLSNLQVQDTQEQSSTQPQILHNPPKNN